MGTHDSAIHVGAESTYGTEASSYTRSYEGKADSFSTELEPLESVGMRPGLQGIRSDRRKMINQGGNGSIEVDWLTDSMGRLLSSIFTNVGTPTQVSGIAYSTEFSTGSDGPSTSHSIQMVRPHVATDTTEVFTHLGCVATGWKISHEVGGFLMAEVDFDFQDVATDAAEGSSNYSTTAEPWCWPDLVITNSGATPTAFHPMGFELNAELGMKTDRRYLRGSALKKQPVRTSLPTYTGRLTGLDFDDLDEYNDFVGGGVYDLQATWTGDIITGATAYSVTIDIPNVQLDEGTPVSALNELTKVDLPFTVLHDGSEDMITVTVVSTDTTL